MFSRWIPKLRMFLLPQSCQLDEITRSWWHECCWRRCCWGRGWVMWTTLTFFWSSRSRVGRRRTVLRVKQGKWRLFLPVCTSRGEPHSAKFSDSRNYSLASWKVHVKSHKTVSQISTCRWFKKNNWASGLISPEPVFKLEFCWLPRTSAEAIAILNLININTFPCFYHCFHTRITIT